jgi:hypothetical protein
LGEMDSDTALALIEHNVRSLVQELARVTISI